MMYSKRIKIFVILIALFLLAFLVRLTQMQLFSGSFYRDRIAKLRLQAGRSRQLRTIRGEILDRKDRALAVDEPKFQLCMDYTLSSIMDERVRRAELLRAMQKGNPDAAVSKMKKKIENGLEVLERVINKCVHFGLEGADIKGRIEKINNRLWDLRSFLAWARNGPGQNVLEKYDNKVISVPLSEATADFEKKFPDKDQRLLLINKVRIDDLPDSDKIQPILQLKTDDDIFAAQVEFMDINGVQILPKALRSYPYSSAAAQTIGWVGLPQESDKDTFENDRLSRYLGDEVCGREDGVEYVCETILRGRRGEVVYDIDRELISRTETEFGEDVRLTLDVELQQRIEEYLLDCGLNSNCSAPTAAVVIDVATGDILSLVSVPVFDLNRIRQNYNSVRDDPNKPLLNRAVNEQYPPGSVIKPLILISGLEAGVITADEIINCPARKAPTAWPSCWLYNRYGVGHDDKWQNYTRNAVKGSCNIYFSRLANRIEPAVFQQWLFSFGYGREILAPPGAVREDGPYRNFRQAAGQISSIPAKNAIPSFEQLPVLNYSERRLFGIGQGNFRVTALQVANAMAAIARGGVYMPPRLFMEDANDFESASTDLGISAETLAVVREGMSAVVNESGGTAYKEFAPAGFSAMGIEVFGKTGSTEQPDNAWFAGFAEDGAGRGIAVAVVVEGGQHGSADAGPLARDIIQFCIEEEYLGGI
ncbi:MAG: penicillin-binding transpeptidase domain-containing protein [Planctomycetota bacterium]|jgi:penicillin-binding protein 2